MRFNPEPQPIVWIRSADIPYVEEIHLGGRMVAWIEPRPAYCDRGHWKVGFELPGMDLHDGVPRYYMSNAVAKSETEAFLRWRLWKYRGG